MIDPGGDLGGVSTTASLCLGGSEYACGQGLEGLVERRGEECYLQESS